MHKPLKITLNLLIFLLIAGFGYYIIHATMSENKTITSDNEKNENAFVSSYQKVDSFETDSDILSFCISNNTIYVALANKVSVFDLSGKHLFDFEIDENARDILVEDAIIYLLYPTKIERYSLESKKIDEWQACSNNSDYCAITTSEEYVFITDAENKLIHQYNKNGALVRFIKSPNGFIIPSYSFDIININDTLYCSNSGRHQIESYTINGDFIASFGQAGAQAGAFSGCCNPVYLEKTTNGEILTSEKGTPRISCYGKDGKFISILFDNNMLGNETSAYRMRVGGENIFIAHNKTIVKNIPSKRLTTWYHNL